MRREYCPRCRIWHAHIDEAALTRALTALHWAVACALFDEGGSGEMIDAIEHPWKVHDACQMQDLLAPADLAAELLTC